MNDEKWKRFLGLMPREMADRDRGDEDMSLPLGKGNLDYVVDCYKILDVGCGTGVAMNALRDAGKDVAGITINPAEKEWGIKKYGEWIKDAVTIGDVHDLPYQDKSFDAVILWEVLEHALAPLVLLWECNRVLKENGRMAVMVPHECYTNIADHTIVTNHAQTRALLAHAGFNVEDFWDMTGQSGRYWCLKIRHIGGEK